MQKTIYFCDRCGKEISGVITKALGYDLCNPCSVKACEVMAEFVRGKQAKEDEPEKVKLTPKKPVKDWDKGKAQALRDAGWTIMAIAQELGVSEPTICKHTHPAQPKKERPNEWAEKEPDLSTTTRSMMGEKHVEEAEEVEE